VNPAENGSGKISVVTVSGDKATVTVIKEGLRTPTAGPTAGDTIWIGERYRQGSVHTDAEVREFLQVIPSST
jgi:hypothetical protein